MNEKILCKLQKELWAKISGVSSSFYLAGGTALALHLGHRESIDFDFFIQEEFSPEKLLKKLKKIGVVNVLDQSESHINIIINSVKVSYFHYPYQLIEDCKSYKNINIAQIKDILPMKLIAVSQRSVKKDFIDIYAAIKNGWALDYMFELLSRKFSGISYNHVNILKGLTYFEDAEKDEMPKVLDDIAWEDVKLTLEKEALRILNC